MFSRLRDFVQRHKRKFLVTGVVVGGAVLLTRYIKQKVQQWQEWEMDKLMDRAKRQQHFENTERTCNLTILSIVPSFKATIVKVLDSDDLTSQLKKGPVNRLEIWERLKVVAFTRIAALVYGGTLLVILLRVQLNIVGGCMYHDSVVGVDDTQLHTSRSFVDTSLQQRYLALCEEYVEKGLPALCDYLEKKVQSVVQGISLKQKLSLRDVRRVLESVQSAVREDEGGNNPARNPNWYTFPNQNPQERMDDGHEQLFSRMVCETMDVLESEDTLCLMHSCVAQGFSHLVNILAEYFPGATFGKMVNLPSSNSTQTGIDQENTIPKTLWNSLNHSESVNTVKQPSDTTLDYKQWVNNVCKQPEDDCMSSNTAAGDFSTSECIYPTNVHVPLAKLIPVLNGLIYWGQGSSLLPVSDESPDSWIQHLILMDTVKTLGANVYESFCQAPPEIG